MTSGGGHPDNLSLLDSEAAWITGGSSGPRCLVLARPAAHTATVLVRVAAGSRGEPEQARGAAHLLEHLFLRGTATLADGELAKWIDSIGGVLRPFTTREFTALLAQVPARNWEAGLRVLLDMAVAPGFTSADVDAELSVVVEELRSTHARPEQITYDLLHEAELAGTGLDRTVIGDESDVQALSYGMVREFHEENYTDTCGWDVIAVGGVSSEEVTALLGRHLEQARPERGVALDGALAAAGTGEAPFAAAGLPRRPAGATHRRLEGDYPYSYVGLGTKVAGLDQPSSLACQALDSILGGGLSSRMVASIRDHLGWAYDVYSMYEPYTDAGLLMTFAAVAPERTDEALEEMQVLIRSLADQPVHADELERAVSRLDGQARTTADDPAALCSQLAGLLLGRGEQAYAAASPLFGARTTLEEVRELGSHVGQAEWSSVVVRAS